MAVVALLCAAQTLSISADYFAQLYMRALDEWNLGPAHVRLAFANMGGCDRSGYVIAFDAKPGSGNGLTYHGAVDMPVIFSRNDADVLVLNTECNWIGGAQSRRTALNVMEHELGHVFGLGHTSDYRDIMFSSAGEYLSPNPSGIMPVPSRPLTNADRVSAAWGGHPPMLPTWATGLPNFVFGASIMAPDRRSDGVYRLPPRVTFNVVIYNGKEPS